MKAALADPEMRGWDTGIRLSQAVIEAVDHLLD